MLFSCNTVAPPRSSPPTLPEDSPGSEPSEHGWLQLDLDFADPQTLTAVSVRGGTLDGRTTIDSLHRFPPFGGEGGGLRRAMPFVSAFAGGNVLYGYSQRDRSELLIATPRTGASSLLVATTDIIHSAAMGVDGWIYYVVLDRDRREERGIFRLRLGGQPEPFIPAPRLRSAPFEGSALFVTPESKYLLVQDCGVDTCVLRSYRTSTAEPAGDIATTARRPLGVFPEHVVLADVCVAPCPAVAVSLGDDSKSPVGVACDRAVAIELNGDLVVVSSDRRDCIGDARDLVAVSHGGARIELGKPDFAGLELVESSVSTAVELPPESVVLASGGTLTQEARGVLLDVSSLASSAFDIQRP